MSNKQKSSDRTLMDLQPVSYRMSSTYDNLSMANNLPLTFRTLSTL